MSDPVTDPDRLAEIRQRRAAINSPTPWSADIEGGIWVEGDGRLGTAYREGDAEFIAHAPADIDWLAGEIDGLRGLLRDLLDAYKEQAAPLVDPREPERYRQWAKELVERVEREFTQP